MSKLIKKNANSGIKVYKSSDTLITTENIKEADRLLSKLKKEFPKIETDLFEMYESNNLLMKYELGKYISEIVISEGITEREYSDLWKELYDFVDSKQNSLKRTQSSNRNTFLYCFKLYNLGIDIAQKLTWRRWNDIFDRSFHNKDKRFYEWLSNINKISNDEFRFFLVGLNIYYSLIDTTFLTDYEYNENLSRILEISTRWFELKEKHFDMKKNKMSKARIEKISKYKKKYFEEVIHKMILVDDPNLESITEKCFEDNFIKV